MDNHLPLATQADGLARRLSNSSHQQGFAATRRSSSQPNLQRAATLSGTRSASLSGSAACCLPQSTASHFTSRASYGASCIPSWPSSASPSAVCMRSVAFATCTCVTTRPRRRESCNSGMGHAGEDMSDLYDKINEDVAFQRSGGRGGFGF